MKSDTTEKGLESLIETALLSAGWLVGTPADYNREYAVDLAHLSAFLTDTQPDAAEGLDLAEDGPTRRKFLARLQGEITKRGVVDVLRHGIKHGPLNLDLFCGTPSPGNPAAAERFAKNRFSVTRQLRYSPDATQLALDLCLFINGLPVATFELKNSLTKQTVDDAIEQYRHDRDPRELLFQFGRCLAHFAVDDQQVFFCTQLKGKASWFLPFNQGWNDGAGNPPNRLLRNDALPPEPAGYARETDAGSGNSSAIAATEDTVSCRPEGSGGRGFVSQQPANPGGLKTDYLWKRILTREGLTDIIENYAQLVEGKDEKSGKKRRDQIFPRYHQLDVVRKLLAAVSEDEVGTRYLIEHSAGSGKSNSIAWLAHQLIGLQRNETDLFDSIIVVTDRRILDKQIKDTIKQFAQVGATVGHAEDSADLRTFIQGGKKIIISTVQKFPFILDAIGSEHRGRDFAIVIDEAHSSQGGKTSAAVSGALGAAGVEEQDETLEDQINRIMESRKLLTNASYFAFTATPKNKTLEIFGQAIAGANGGVVAHRPFHSYSMKQAIQEGFILDVLKSYTPVASYYKLTKTVPGDPEFDTKKARKKLRRYVEGNDHAIRLKAEIMVDHFGEQVIGMRKIGGEARAMVVTSGIERAIQYYHAFQAYLAEIKSPYRAIVAFSGEHEYGGVKVTEASLNGFPSGQIADKIQEDPYRFLICADKFQTGYDEPLLHTMYVDKVLSGIKAVQTLSRLNRARPGKHDTFVLDFMNDADVIRASFEPYYRTTILSEETDPNKLHDLKAALDAHQVYSVGDIDRFVELYLGGADREQLDPILDACVATYLADLGEDAQVDFKGKAKAFSRTYAFLSLILPFTNADWEKLSIFLDFLLPKLPAPIEPDLAKGILEAIDMESYRVEKKAALTIHLADADGGVEPWSVEGGGHKPEPELDRLSNILAAFNELFGNIDWTDEDRIRRMITAEIPEKVAADKAYQNARKNSDKQNARIEHDKALERVIVALMKDDTQLFKEFQDNESFKKWLADTVFRLTYAGEAA